jgi:hypothetical protein
MSDDIYVNAVGVEFRLDVGESLSGATKMEIQARKPSGAIVTWTAVQYGATTKITYTTGATDLDEAGTWTFQAYVEWGSTSKHWGLAVEKEVWERWEIVEES